MSPKTIDKLSKKFGWPVGTATLADEVGLDVAAHITAHLGPLFGARMGGSNPEILGDMVAKGFCGM